MEIKLFKEFNSMSNICDRCGNEFWGDLDICDDCKDSDLEDNDTDINVVRTPKKRLPFFEVPTTKSQNIYYL